MISSRSFLCVQAFAERADCSEPGARTALKPLSEMGIAERHDGDDAGDAADGDLFGHVVSIDGGTAIVGARSGGEQEIPTGVVYILE